MMRRTRILAVALLLSGCALPRYQSSYSLTPYVPAPISLYKPVFPILLPSGSKAKTVDAVAATGAEKAASDQMKDPSSSQFRNLRVRPAAAPENRVVCGEINAKNSYGGYVGFKPFLLHVSPDGPGKWLASEAMLDFQKLSQYVDLYRKYCA